jgi:hypothetical protein
MEWQDHRLVKSQLKHRLTKNPKTRSPKRSPHLLRLSMGLRERTHQRKSSDDLRSPGSIRLIWKTPWMTQLANASTYAQLIITINGSFALDTTQMELSSMSHVRTETDVRARVRTENDWAAVLNYDFDPVAIEFLTRATPVPPLLYPSSTPKFTPRQNSKS